MPTGSSTSSWGSDADTPTQPSVFSSVVLKKSTYLNENSRPRLAARLRPRKPRRRAGLLLLAMPSAAP